MISITHLCYVKCTNSIQECCTLMSAHKGEGSIDWGSSSAKGWFQLILLYSYKDIAQFHMEQSSYSSVIDACKTYG